MPIVSTSARAVANSAAQRGDDERTSLFERKGFMDVLPFCRGVEECTCHVNTLSISSQRTSLEHTSRLDNSQEKRLTDQENLPLTSVIRVKGRLLKQ